MLGRLLFLIFLIVPIIEIGLFILVGQAIGFWPTVAAILIIAIIGAAVIRRQGLSLLGEIRGTMGRGQLPARALADAMLVGIAGVLMVVPGFFTDTIGLLLLIPALRHWGYGFLRRRLGFADAPVRPATRTTRAGTIDLDDEEFRPR